MPSPRERIILMALEDSGGLSGKQLAKHLTLTPSYIRAVLGRLFLRGLIEQVHGNTEQMSPNQVGGKPSKYVITEQGRQSLNDQG